MNNRRTILIAASGWVTALFVGLLNLPSEFLSFHHDAPVVAKMAKDWWMTDSGYSGTWIVYDDSMDSSQLRITAPPEESALIPNLTVYGGKVDGEIASDGLKNGYVFSPIMVTGARRPNGLELYAFDFVGGDALSLATIRLVEPKREGSRDTVEFEVIQQVQKLFPEHAKLVRVEQMDIDGQLDMKMLLPKDQKNSHPANPNKLVSPPP